MRAFVDSRYNLVGVVHHDFLLLLEAFKHLLVCQFCHIVEFHRLELLGSKGNFHCHDFEETQAATFIVVVLQDVADTVPNHVADVHAETFTDESMTALLVDDCTLLVHDVVVFKQVLTDAEVILLDLLLCVLDAASNHAVLNHLAILEAKAVHHSGNTLAGEESHQLVLDADEEDTASWVALTTGTSAELTVHATAFMTFCADDGQATCRFHFRRELDIRTTTCHVGGDGYGAEQSFFCLYEFKSFARLALLLLGSFCLDACLITDSCALLVEGASVCCNIDGTHSTLTCQSHDVCFLLVQFCVQNLMRYLAHLEHL